MKRITDVAQIEDFAFPGGYAVIYLGSEGVIICPDCARESLGGNDPTLFAITLECGASEVCEDCGKEVI